MHENIINTGDSGGSRMAPATFLTDQQRSSLRWLKHRNRVEEMALRLDELMRLVARQVAQWNKWPGDDRLHMHLAYGCSATLLNWGNKEGFGPPPKIVGTRNVALRVDDDLTDRKFEFRFDPSILDADDPEGAIAGTIAMVTGQIDQGRGEAWQPGEMIEASQQAQQESEQN